MAGLSLRYDDVLCCELAPEVTYGQAGDCGKHRAEAQRRALQ